MGQIFTNVSNSGTIWVEFGQRFITHAGGVTTCPDLGVSCSNFLVCLLRNILKCLLEFQNFHIRRCIHLASWKIGKKL